MTVLPRTLRALALALAAGAIMSLLAAPAALADPPTRACGSLSDDGRTFSLRAANMSCRLARRMMRRGLNARGRVKGYPSYTISAAGCEGIIWRMRDIKYSQAHDGALPPDARFVRFRVTRGCNS